MEKGGRDPTTKRLIPEKHRFPSGIKSLEKRFGNAAREEIYKHDVVQTDF